MTLQFYLGIMIGFVVAFVLFAIFQKKEMPKHHHERPYIAPEDWVEPEEAKFLRRRANAEENAIKRDKERAKYERSPNT